MSIKSKKVTSSSDIGSFTETIKFKVLHCGNVEGNNNKFYCLELQTDGSGNYQLFSHYGRLMSSNIYEVRNEEDGEPLDLQTAEKEFDKIIKKKTKGKTVVDKDGTKRRENYEEIETVKPTVGSINICNKTMETVQVKVGGKKPKIDSSSFDNESRRIVNQIIDENVHNITSLTSLKLTSNGFETPLGPVTKDHIEKARQPLNILKSLLRRGTLDPGLQDVRSSNTKYFSLIPHQFGSKITQADWILDDRKLIEEYDLLDNLESAVQMGSALKKNGDEDKQMNALGSDIELLKDHGEWDRIRKYFENSKASNHRNIWHYKIKNIFKVRIPNERKRFEDQGIRFGNIRELFHGSRNCNILSIMKNGLIIPPCNSPGVTGRMFGDGLYAACNSTKALNYSIGFWSGTRNRYPNTFLFVTKFAMGKIKEVTSQLYDGAPRGYDSVHAKKGHSLYNDEFIVYKLNQATLTHLIELKE